MKAFRNQNFINLVYKFKKLIGRNDFSFQFRKIITHNRRIGYNLDVMRQSACLVFDPITVDNYAAFFNCTPETVVLIVLCLGVYFVCCWRLMYVIIF